MKRLLRPLAAACLALLTGCNPQVDVYAPDKDIYIVYGVLDPEAAVQYVTVTKAFQYEGDATLYAAQNDLSARGLRVQLRSDSLTWDATPVEVYDSVPNLFSQTTGAYRFETAGATALAGGRRYDLRITKPDDPDFLITAHTVTPSRPRLLQPGEPIYSIEQQVFTLPSMEFSEDNEVVFEKGSGNGFELRVFVEYETADGPKVLRWGPTPVFKSSERCPANEDLGRLCYELQARSVPNVMRSIFAGYPDTVEVYDTLRVAQTVDSLNRKVWLEVTAVDSFLTTYLTANQPFGFGTNLLMDKPEYTNISGENAGIFGSIYRQHEYIFLGSCTRWMAGLRGRRPSGCGE